MASRIGRASLLGPIYLAGALTVDRASAESGITDLGALDPQLNISVANGVSADGNFVAVDSRNSQGYWQAFRWTETGGTVGLGSLNGGMTSSATGISADGSVIVGLASDGAARNAQRAFRWDQGTGMVSLGVLNGGTYSAATGVSGDGSVIVGYAADGAAHNYELAFRWTEAAGMVSLGGLNGGQISSAYAVSADGNVVVGSALDGAGTINDYRAFRWTEPTGMVSLGVLNGGTYSSASGVSADGNVVVGTANDATHALRAFRWTQTAGMLSLGTLRGGFSSEANGVSADGGVVVGIANDGAAGDVGRAFRWTAATGMQTVEDWLRANGVTVPRDITSAAYAVNADGNVVVGELEGAHAFIARVESTPTDGGDETGGSGLLALDDALTASLDSPSAVPLTALRTGDLVLHGAHGRPLSYRVGTGQKTAWASGDLGQDDHDPLDGDMALAEVGGGYNFGPVQANLAVGRTWADQDLTDNGDLNAAGTYLWAEALVPLYGSLWGVMSGYYQWGDADVRRGYLNAGSPDSSKGSPDTRTWGLRGRLEWDAVAKVGGVSLSPYGELSYLHTRMDAYTESGGGFPVAYNASEEDATDLHLGVNAAYQLSTETQIFGLLEGVHRFNDSAAPISGEVVGLFPFQLPGQDYNQNWLRAGLGVAARLGPGLASLSVNATTEGEAPDAWLAGTYQVSF